MTTSPFARSTGYARVKARVVVRVRVIIDWDLDWVRIGVGRVMVESVP